MDRSTGLRIKSDIQIRGRTMRQAAAELGIDYLNFAKYLGSYLHEPPDFHSRVTALLAKWDAIDRPAKTEGAR